MINGAHIIINSTDADADRAFFRDVLKWPHVDAGGGWLIFKLPPAEVAVHPYGTNDEHELYLTCSDLGQVMKDLEAAGRPCGEVIEAPWGTLTHIGLPGGGKLGLYEPKHPMAATL